MNRPRITIRDAFATLFAVATIALLILIAAQNAQLIRIQQANGQAGPVPSSVAAAQGTPVTVGGTPGTARATTTTGSGGTRTPPSRAFPSTVPTAIATDPTDPPTPTSVRAAQAGPVLTVTPTPGSARANVRRIALQANDLVYDHARGHIYATVPGIAKSRGNSLVRIDPQTGAITGELFVGSEPNKLALSDDARVLYIALDGSGAVRRLDLESGTLEEPFTLGGDKYHGPYGVETMAVVPGRPAEIAIALKNSGVSPRHAGVAIYRDGVALPNMTPNHTGSNSIAFCGSADWLYGYNNESSEYGFRAMTLDAEGVRIADVKASLVAGYYNMIVCDGGLIYATSGQVLDPSTKTLVGTYSGISGNSLVRPDTTRRRTYFIAPATTASTSKYKLLTFDQQTFRLINSLDLPELVGEEAHPLSGGTRSLIRWGADSLAYRGKDQVFLLQVP